jgi:hypothetical protein
MTEIINVSKKEYDNKINEKLAEGFDISSKTESQCILEKKEYGNPVWHIVIFVFLGWWTLLIANIIYLAFCYVNKSRKIIMSVK